jgi:hypothetical protein
MPPPKSDFDRELQVLEIELKRLEADYNQFFAGRLPRLPWDQRARVDAMMKKFDRMHIKNTGDRFRFQTIQSRWAAFAELWERQMKAQETGRRPGRPVGRGVSLPPELARPEPREPAHPGLAPVQQPSVTPPPTPTPSSNEERVVAVASVADPRTQTDRVQSLYEQLAQARKDAGEKPVPFERFTELVQAQVKKLGEGGREVAFRVAVKGGKVTLTAKPVEEES